MTLLLLKSNREFWGGWGGSMKTERLHVWNLVDKLELELREDGIGGKIWGIFVAEASQQVLL